MALKNYRPTSPGRRQLVTVSRKELHNGKPEKTLTVGLSKSGGRNNTGRVTSWHRGGGHKRKYRIIDFKRIKHDMFATVERIEYDPNRSAYVALVKYEDGLMNYIIAPNKIKTGDEIISGRDKKIEVGNCMPLSDIPTGTDLSLIHI